MEDLDALLESKRDELVSEFASLDREQKDIVLCLWNQLQLEPSIRFPTISVDVIDSVPIARKSTASHYRFRQVSELQEPTMKDYLVYGQALLTTYRLVKRGIIPDPEIIQCLNEFLDPALAKELAETQNHALPPLFSTPNEPTMEKRLTRVSLANKALKDCTNRMSRLVVLPNDAASQVSHAVRLEALKDVHFLLSQKYLKQALRTPDKIYKYLIQADQASGILPTWNPHSRLSRLLGLKRTDRKEDFAAKVKMLLATTTHTPPAAPWAKSEMLDAGIHPLFQTLNQLRKHQIAPVRAQLASIARMRDELGPTVKSLNERKRRLRENARAVAVACGNKKRTAELERQAERERKQRDRMRMLRECNMEAYAEMIKGVKNRRIQEVLDNTEKLLADIGAKIQLEKGSTAPVPAESAESVGSEGEKKKAKFFTMSHRVKEEVVQPACLIGGKLMSYQLAGLEYLVSLWNNNLSGILADEMGLGKTIQTIALFAYLKEFKNVHGPHLIAVPLSTLPNWASELERWCPSLTVLQYRGPKQDRRLLAVDVKKQKFNVLLTTFEYILRDTRVLAGPKWKLLIVDEGHKMKNIKSKFHATLGEFRSTNRILLTGTPLQNNLNELWSLLNFLMPQTFSSGEDFERWFEEPFRDQFGEGSNKEEVSLTEEEKLVVINRLHLVLRPFLFRRIKADVLQDLPSKREYTVRVALTIWQQKVYDQLVNKCLKVRDASGKMTSKSVANVIMQLRKLVNHPYLFLDQYHLDANVWRTAGKFEILDRMIPKLLKFKHKILIFCQMTSVMDIMGDYFDIKGIKYHRLDGSMMLQDRQERMEDFNDPASSTHVFMLSTRAGGLGLNLQTADTVILFDSDWNPHADLQAQARAHRVGQKEEVRVFRLVTTSPIEEWILQKAQHKLSIDEQIIQAGMFTQRFSDEEREDRLRALLSQNRDEAKIRVTSPQELLLYMARTPQEEEAFAQMDRQLFGARIYRQFYDHDDTLDPSDENSSEPATARTLQPPTTKDKLSTKELSRTEQLLVASGRTVGEHEIPSDILIGDEPLKEEEGSQDLGPRKCRMRAQKAQSSEQISNPSKSEELNPNPASSDEHDEESGSREGNAKRRRVVTTPASARAKHLPSGGSSTRNLRAKKTPGSARKLRNRS